MKETQMVYISPSVVIQCVQAGLRAAHRDDSEASAAKELKRQAKLSKKKRAMMTHVIDQAPDTHLQCVQCALEYIKKDHSEETAKTVWDDMQNREYTPEGDDGLPTGYGHVGLENLIAFMGYDKHTVFMECYHIAVDRWISRM